MESRGQDEEELWGPLQILLPGMEISGSSSDLDLQTQLPPPQMESHGRVEESHFRTAGLGLRGMDVSGSQLEIVRLSSRLPMELRGRHERPHSVRGIASRGMEVSGSRQETLGMGGRIQSQPLQMESHGRVEGCRLRHSPMTLLGMEVSGWQLEQERIRLQRLPMELHGQGGQTLSR
jgi:hypothetical protein